MIKKRTITEWVKYLSTARITEVELTIEEFQARCLMDIRDNLIALRESNQHVEGMQTAQDEYHRNLAALAGIPYPNDLERVERIQAHKDRLYRRQGLEPPIVDMSSLPIQKSAEDFT